MSAPRRTLPLAPATPATLVQMPPLLDQPGTGYASKSVYVSAPLLVLASAVHA
ncbi:MAG: hypothetical protein QXT64_05900 [Desulfurococcaceae archaeon]